MDHKNTNFLKRFSYAIKGLKEALKRESSFRIQCFCAVLLLVFCLVVRPSPVWCAIFAVTSAMILGLELVNSALEALIDRLHPEKHPEIGFVKDCLAGAVLIASLGAILIFAIYLISNFVI